MSKRMAVGLFLVLAGLPATARAHRDALDGPVVKTARIALGEVNPVLA